MIDAISIRAHKEKLAAAMFEQLKAMGDEVNQIPWFQPLKPVSWHEQFAAKPEAQASGAGDC